MFRSHQVKVTCELLMELPGSLSEQERNTLLRCFEIGRAHLFYTFILKLSAFSAMPLRLLACAHHLRTVAVAAIQEALAADVHLHPKLAELQSEPLVTQAGAFMDGTPLEDLTELELFITKLKFGFAVERRIEGGHARITRRVAVGTHRNEVLDSLAVRTPEIKAKLEKDPGFIKELASILNTIRSPKLVTRQLGMALHPALVQAGNIHAWDKLYRRVVYRSDPLTVYGDLVALHMFDHVPTDLPPLADAVAEPIADGEANMLAIVDATPGDLAMVASEIPTYENADFLRDAALDHLRKEIEDMNCYNRMFCCKAPGDCIDFLTNKIAGKTSDDKCLRSLCSLNPLSAHLWFSVVKHNPSQGKRTLRGSLNSNDLAINVHKLLAKEATVNQYINQIINRDRGS